MLSFTKEIEISEWELFEFFDELLPIHQISFMGRITNRLVREDQIDKLTPEHKKAIKEYCQRIVDTLSAIDQG